MIRLRGHHLFCMVLFTGHGYDERFTRNMSELLRTLKSDEDASILLVAGDDSVCAACPNLKGISCGLGNGDVTARDLHAREALSLACGQVYPYQALQKALSKVTETEFNRVCANCSWWQQGFCSYEQFKKSIE